jgi:hypothetical protein
MAGDDEVVADALRVRYSPNRLAPPAGGVTAASAVGPSEDGVPSSPPSNLVGARWLRRVRHRGPSASAKSDSVATADARLTARRGDAPCVRRMQMGRSRTETAIRRASERTERTDIQSGERLGVTVRQVTSPNAPLEGAPDPRRRSRSPALIAGAAVVAAAVLFAVVMALTRSGGEDAATTTDPTPTFTIAPSVPSTADPQQTLRAVVIRDYLAAEAAYDEATGIPDGKPPNPDLPALNARLGGAELVQARNYIIGMKAGGLTALGPPAQGNPKVVSVTSTTATVHDCYTSSNHIVDARTHALRDKPGTVTRGVEATMQLDQTSGVWKLVNVAEKPELCPAS